MTGGTFECIYTFESTKEKEEIKFEVPFPSNFEEPCEEYAARYTAESGLPIFVRDTIASTLKKAIREKQREISANFFSGTLPSFLNKVDELCDDWDQWYLDDAAQKPVQNAVSDEEVFAEAYHNLLHCATPGLVPILQKEQATAAELNTLVAERDCEIEMIKERQAGEMQEIMAELETGLVNEDVVNATAEKHHFECDMALSAWDSQIGNLHQSRREEFRSWIMSLRSGTEESGVGPQNETNDWNFDYEEEFDRSSRHGIPEGKKHKKKIKFWRENSEPTSSSGKNSLITSPSGSSLVDQNLEESFTIQLGAQMKQTHNLRLLAAGAFSLCKAKNPPEKNGYPDPIRMHTAMSLYSEKLHGVVIFVDNRISSYSGRKREFASICETGPEFHFAPLGAQLEIMRTNILPEALEWRQQHATSASPHEVTASSAAASKNSITQGDFYVTTHSNLEQAHVVFHMVTDGEAVLSTDAISSRHPVILGLRNILKACSLSDITTLSVPLFLTHEMAEEMTISWCVKRAELVFKCMKGFMMEMASWGGSLITTLQFVVPEEVTDNLFNQLAALLPSVFRVSNPLVVKSSSK